MKPTSCFIFPFVFWVSLLISVILRQYLWVISAPTTGKDSIVRVKGVLSNLTDNNISKAYINVNDITIRLDSKNQILNEDIATLAGRRLTIYGTLRLKSPNNKYSGFVLEKAIITHASTQVSRLTKAKITLNRLAAAIRRHFQLSLGAQYSVRQSALMVGMLLGVKQKFSYEFYRQLQQSGLLHLIAASGYNISIVVGAIGGLTGLLVSHRLIKTIIVTLFISLYILIAGAEASVVRAGIMGTLGFLAIQLGSSKSTGRVFVLVALLMLFFKPAWAWDLGYQLSVAATAGLIWLEPRLRRPHSGNVGDFPGKGLFAIKELTATLAASFATLPVLITRLGWERVSWAGILANLPAGLLVTPIMVIGTVGSLLSLVWPWGGYLVAIIGRPVIAALVALIQFSAWLNGLIVN